MPGGTVPGGTVNEWQCGLHSRGWQASLCDARLAVRTRFTLTFVVRRIELDYLR
jgi:hypothetical protein